MRTHRSRFTPSGRLSFGFIALWFSGVFLVGSLCTRAATVVKLGAVQPLAGPDDLDLDGEFAYAVNFSANDPVKVVKGVTFTPDRTRIVGATFLGPQQVSPWMTKPEFGSTADANALEDLFEDIRWANSGAGERLRATLAITNGIEYKLQILISGNNAENRRWDIRINGQDAVDEITSLGVSPGQTYSQNLATLYSYQFVAKTNSFVVEMGNLFGQNDGGDRNPIWQALTLEKVFIPPTPDDLVLEPAEFFASQQVPVGRLRVIDRKGGATHSLLFADGEGATDNGKFAIVGTNLVMGGFDFSGQAPNSTYSIRLRAVDTKEPTRVLEKMLTVTLRAPSAPSSLSLDATSISQDAKVGQVLAEVTVADLDRFDRHVVDLLAGPGGEDNERVTVVGQQVRLATALPAGATAVRLRLRATDLAGLTTAGSFVLPVSEPQVRINEVVASELGGVANEGGILTEWVEIQNLRPQWVDLTGFYLTDQAGDPKRWAFPGGLLPPNGFLLLLADGVGKTPSGSSLLHLNFSVDATGSRILLFRPDGLTLVHELRAPTFFPGVAYGYGPDGLTGYLPTPTPRATNSIPAEFGENKVVFSRPHGFYAKGFDLELTATVSNSVIRYTTDGTLPTATRGTIYTNPIPVHPNTAGATRGSRIIRAVAVNSRAAYAAANTQTYLFVNGEQGPAVDGLVSQTVLTTAITRNTNYAPLIDDAFLALPAMSLILPNGPNDTERVASLELFDPAGREEGFQIDCGVQATGTTSLGSPKLSMAARFRAAYGVSKLKYPVYAQGSMMPRGAATEFKELRLRSHSHDTFYWLGTSENPPVPYGNPPVNRSGDAQLGRNVWIDEMQLFMGQVGKHAKQVHMFLNGTYHGLYHIQEHPDEDFMASYLPGSPNDFHFSAAALSGSDHSNGDSWSQVWAKLKASLSNYAQAKRWVDVTNLCDYMALSFYAGNDWDWSAQHNWSAAGPKLPDQGGWKFFAQDSDISLQDVTADCTDQDVPDGIFTALMNHAEFRLLFRDRVYRHCFNGGMLTPEKAGGLYDIRMSEISTAIVAETARWQPSSSVSTLPWDRNQEWTNEWNYLRNTFFPNRVPRLIQQLRQHSGWWPAEPPELGRVEGVVPAGYPLSFSVASGVIYFTLDGSDPRLPSGAANPAARRLNAAPIATKLIASGDLWRFLDNGTDPGSLWKTNGFDDSAWRSGLTEIGYGDGGEATVAEFIDTDPVLAGIQKNITTFFRKSFNVANPEKFNALRLRLVRDDGAVVYLNGLEIWRTNMTTSVITPKTLALRDVSGAEESTFYEVPLTGPRTVLRSEGNVIAVEIHQRAADNVDMSFNLELVAYSPDPTATYRIDQPTLIRARTLVGTEWSALVEAFLVPDTVARASSANLLLSEIHYRPLDQAGNEFLEFLNTSPSTIDASDVTLSGGVSFRFPRPTLLGPGERIVVVRDPALFTARYQTNTSPYYRAGLRVVGPFAGSLANEGEAIDVNAATGERLFSCNYGVSGAWPTRADGDGSSLELVDEEGAPASPAERTAWLSDGWNWRPSVEFHGSPGVAGEEPPASIVINEVMAAPEVGGSDAIELVNPTGVTVDLSGWYLGDSRTVHKKYRFPSATLLEPHQYLVLREADFNRLGNPASLIPFGLDAGGDQVVLTQSNPAGELLRFIDFVEFGASATGAALGRFPDGMGPMRWLQGATWGFGNAEPLPGFAAWAGTAFPPETSADQRLATADPDGDGLDNFAEYAFGTSPLRRSGLPFRFLDFSPAEGLLFSYSVQSFAPELSYRVEVSADLRTWEDAGARVTVVSRTPHPDGSSLVIARFHLAEDPLRTTASFLRIGVTAP